MIWGAIWKWVTGDLVGQLTKAYELKKAAETDKERIRADIVVSQLESRLAAQTTGEWTWVTKLVQACWAAPFIIYNSKVIVWDKVLGLGVTDPLGPFETNIGLVIVGFYFLSVSIKGLRR